MAANEEVPDFLNIAVVAAHGLKNTAMIGKQDLYVSATYGPHTLKTSTVQKGGTMPLWPGGPDTFNFVMDGSQRVHIQVWVPHKMKDDVEIGAATLQEAAWAGMRQGAPPQEMLLPLYRHDKPAGTLKTFVYMTHGPPGHALPRPPNSGLVMGMPAQQPPHGQPQHGYATGPYGAAPYQETPAAYQPAPYSEHAAAAGQQQQVQTSTAGSYTHNPFAPQQGHMNEGVAQQAPSYAPQQPAYPPQYGYAPQQAPSYGQPSPYGMAPYPPQGGMPVLYGNQSAYPQRQRPYGRGMGTGMGMGTGGMFLAGGAGLAGGLLLGEALANDGGGSDYGGDMGGGDFGGGDMGDMGDMGGGM